MPRVFLDERKKKNQYPVSELIFSPHQSRANQPRQARLTTLLKKATTFNFYYMKLRTFGQNYKFFILFSLHGGLDPNIKHTVLTISNYHGTILPW